MDLACDNENELWIILKPSLLHPLMCDSVLWSSPWKGGFSSVWYQSPIVAQRGMPWLASLVWAYCHTLPTVMEPQTLFFSWLQFILHPCWWQGMAHAKNSRAVIGHEATRFEVTETWSPAPLPSERVCSHNSDSQLHWFRTPGNMIILHLPQT